MELKGASADPAAPSDSSKRPVSLRGRALDLVGALLFLAGGSVFVWAWVGFQGVSAYDPSPEEGAWAAVRVADQYWRLQKIGTALMLAGIAVFVSAWWVAGRAGRRAGPPE